MIRRGIFAVVSILSLVGCSASTAFFRQGQSAMAAGDYDRAAQAFSLALVENPQHIGALTSLGIAYSRREGFEAAIDALERAEAMAPDEPGIRLYLGLAYLRQGQLDVAHQYLAAFLERTRNRTIAEHTLRTLAVLKDATLRTACGTISPTAWKPPCSGSSGLKHCASRCAPWRRSGLFAATRWCFGARGRADAHDSQPKPLVEPVMVPTCYFP